MWVVYSNFIHVLYMDEFLCLQMYIAHFIIVWQINFNPIFISEINLFCSVEKFDLCTRKVIYYSI